MLNSTQAILLKERQNFISFSFLQGSLENSNEIAPLCALAVSTAWETLGSRIWEDLTWLHCSSESNPVPLQRASAEVRLPLTERMVVLEMLEAVFWERKTI